MTKKLFTRLSQRGTAFVLSPRMCVLMTMAARNEDKVMSAMFMQKYVPAIRSVRLSKFSNSNVTYHSQWRQCHSLLPGWTKSSCPQGSRGPEQFCRFKLESVQLRRHCNSKATPTSRQSIWQLPAFSVFFCSKILRFGKFRLATTNAGHMAPRPLSALNKQQIRTDFAVNLRCLLHTL